MKNSTRSLILGTAFATSALLVGCSATGEASGGATSPLPGGGSASVDFRVGFGGDKEADVTATKPVCIEMCFSGADGAELGCETIEVPGSAQVPAGAVRWEASVVDCPESGGGNNDGGGMFDPFAQGPQNPPVRQQVPISTIWWELLGGTVIGIADGSTNVSYSFKINAPSLNQAKTRRDTVLAGGIGTAVGQGFNILYYSESEAEFDVTGVPTGVRMRQAEAKDDFTTYSLTINGSIFAELGVTGNLLHYGASNQWDVVETFVPTSAFDTSTMYDNTAEANWTTQNTSINWYAKQNIEAN